MKGIAFFGLKLLRLFVPVVLVVTVLAVNVHDFMNIYEPRTALLNRVGIERFSYALMGDSIFCSFYVDRNDDTIWKKFELHTGKKCFPGALDGARSGDMVNAAKYISSKIPANSIIFIDISPTKFIKTEKTDKNNYDSQFNDLFKEDDMLLYRFINYFDLDYGRYILSYFRVNKYDLIGVECRNRVWNKDGAFAITRYNDLIEKTEGMSSNDHIKYFEEIDRIFKQKKCKAVFVLTPVNKSEIFSYSDKVSAEEIYNRFYEVHLNTIYRLNDIDACYIDLFGAVPDNCFADLLHTNACGDEIIALSLANYLRQNGKERQLFH